MLKHFTATCEKPYDQCLYLLITEDGKVKSVWDNYESVRDHWMIHRGRAGVQKMKAIMPVTLAEWDKMTNKPKSGGGFA